MVILTELADNPGASIANSAEEIAASMVIAHALPTTRSVWIEHYEHGARGMPGKSATFDLITYLNDDPEPVLRAGVGRWSWGSRVCPTSTARAWRPWSAVG